MDKHNSSNMEESIKENIYKAYKYKMKNTTMTYGLAILLTDPIVIYTIIKIITSKTTDPVKIPITFILIGIVITITIIYLHTFYIKDIIILSRNLKKHKYTYGIGSLTTKEDIGGYESENIGYSRYTFKVDKQYKCKVLVAEDYPKTNIRDECTVLFIRNKPIFAINNTYEELNKYVSTYENTEHKNTAHKQNNKIRLKDIFSKKKGIKGIFTGLVNVYDKLLEKGDNIDDEEMQ